jgi:phosphoribosylanthranilate isomerase
MEDIKIKICGMRDEHNIREVALLHPQYMGFIFYDKSPRFVGHDFRVPDNFPRDTRRVGVFVNERTEAILQKVHEHHLDFVQLHGDESVEQCRILKQAGLRILKVFSVGEDMNFSITKPYQAVVDFFLFDTKGKYFGGNARAFDWKLLTHYDQEIPFFLSGGLSPENIAEIKHLPPMNLHAIDVNSGVEIKPALKDVQKIMTIRSILNTKNTIE